MRILFRLVLNVLALCAALVTAQIALDFAAETIGGHELSRRLSCYGCVHMLEEVIEGQYNPLRDIVFFANHFLVGILSFGLVTYFAARKTARLQSALALIPALGVLFLLAWLGRAIWEPSYPALMRMAFGLELALYAIFAFGGFLLARFTQRASVINVEC